ncbi:MAG: LPS translocon maturation chaperone LptM [Methylocella sp.]
MRRTLPNLPAIVFVAAVAFSLASCGRRGPLELPPGAPPSNAPLSGTPGDYDAPTNPGELEAPPPGTAKKAPPRTPKPFPLDPLL